MRRCYGPCGAWLAAVSALRCVFLGGLYALSFCSLSWLQVYFGARSSRKRKGAKSRSSCRVKSGISRIELREVSRDNFA